jgi:serine/threonine-protein kinase HipA
MATVAAVRLWGTQIGAVLLPDGADVAVFEYDPEFVRNGLQVSPLVMGLSAGPRTFPELSRESF